jgi:spermidine/putrescine-binding protein
MSAKKDASRRNIAAMAREIAPKAMDKLIALMNSDSETVAKDAAIHILDRAIGKPIAMTADVTDRLDELTDDELDAGIAAIKQQIAAAAAKDGTEAPSPTVTH